MAFRPYKTEADQVRGRKMGVIKNSVAIKVGDVISMIGGIADKFDNTADKIAGVVTAIMVAPGISIENAASTGQYDGTWVASTKSYTAASNNQTVKQVMAEYVPVREGDQLWGTLDAAKGTTTGSNVEGYYLSAATADAGLLAENSASTTITNTQFQIVNPLTAGSTTEVIVAVHSTGRFS